MNRYLSSFFISVTIYASIVTSIFYAISYKEAKFKEISKDDTDSIKFTLVYLEPKSQQVIKKKIVKKMQKKKSKLKPKIQKLFKEKKRYIKEKKYETLTLTDPKVNQEKISKKLKEQKEVSKEEKNLQDKKFVQKIKKDKTILEARQNAFAIKLKNLINQNKSYPRAARRRGIEGIVKVKFNVLNDGNINDIKILSGKKIFENSVIKAITKSFPIELENNLFNLPKEFKITMLYTLK